MDASDLPLSIRLLTPSVGGASVLRSLSMKLLYSLLLAFVAMICHSAETGMLATNPIAAINGVLPQGWVVLKVEEGTYPSYRPKGKGTAVALGISGKHYAKQQCSAAVYIMPPDYDDGGDDPTHGQAQSPPARLIATAKNGKLYLWPPNGAAEDWKTMQKDLLKALLKSSESGRREDCPPGSHTT